jgi:hypothetical protein
MSFILLNSSNLVEKEIGYSFGIREIISKDIGYSFRTIFSLDIGYSWQTVIIPVSKNIGYSFNIMQQIDTHIGYSWNTYEYASGSIPFATGFEFYSAKRIKNFMNN